MLVLEQIGDNLVSPIVLTFLFGILAVLVHSDLKFPESVYTALSIYFLFGIGLRAGAALESVPLADYGRGAAMAVMVGTLLPIVCALTLTRVGRFSTIYAGAIASHYGYVSIVTVYAAMNWLALEHVAHDPYIPVLVGLVELPALLVAVLFARARAGGVWRGLASDILAGKSILLIVGGTVIGAFAGKEGYGLVAPFFEEPFEGIACLLLLHLGMVAAKGAADFRKLGWAKVVLFGIAVPLLAGALGAWLGSLAQMPVGDRMVFAALVSSSSYLAAAIAVRASRPRLDPELYFTSSLSLTLPMNLAFGFPLYLAWAGDATGAESWAVPGLAGLLAACSGSS